MLEDAVLPAFERCGGHGNDKGCGDGWGSLGAWMHWGRNGSSSQPSIQVGTKLEARSPWWQHLKGLSAVAGWHIPLIKVQRKLNLWP